MRKCLVAIMVIALLLSSSIAYASVGYKKDGADVGNATTLDLRATHSALTGSVVTFYANGYKDGVTTNSSQESNLDSAALAYGVILLLGDSNSKSISIANGSEGQVITIIMSEYSPYTITLTDDQVASSTVTKTGWDDIAFDARGDMITLLYVDDTYGWIIIGNNGCTVTTE